MPYSPSEIIFAVCVSAFTLAAAICDARSRRIPNYLTVPALLLGVLFRAASDGVPGLAEAGLGFALGFGTLFVLWAIGGGGGGDVKLMGALGVWLGFKATFAVLVCSAVMALFATIVTWFVRVARRTKPTGDAATGDQRLRIPYALPIAGATWLIVTLQATSLIGNLLAI